MTQYSFVAQSRSNTGANSIRIASESGLADEAELMRSINAMTVRGPTWVGEDSRSRIFVSEDLAVLELPLAEVDEAGRRSYVLCYGPLSRHDRSVQARRLATELRDFARVEDRTLGTDHEQLVLGAVDGAWQQGWASRLRPSGAWIRKAKDAVEDTWRATEMRTVIRPQERRLVLFVNEADRIHLRSDRNTRRLLNDPSVTVLDLPLARSLLEQPFVSRIQERDSVRRGDLFVQSALDPDDYFDPEDAAERVAVRKMLLTVQLCQLLGATTVEISEISRRNGSSTNTWRVDPNFKRMISTSVSTTTSARDDVVDRTVVIHRFPGQEPDGGSAKDHLDRHGLRADPHLVALMEMRMSGNALLEQTLDINTRAELERTTEWLGRATVPLGGTEARVDQALKNAVEYTFKFVVKF